MKLGKNNGKKKFALKYPLISAVATFFIACLLSINSQIFLTELRSAFLAFVLLLAVIFVGIIFDVIGVAVAVADPVPFNARSSSKIPGAVQSLRLINNAEKVASFCSDMMGDICGTVSGGMAVAVVVVLPWGKDPQTAVWAATLMSGIVASLTVGGKALSKGYAITQADQIIFNVGRLISWLEEIFLLKKARAYGRGKRGKNNYKGKGR
ncbi:MAG: hypothetical protein ACOX7H_01850 [Bacillota bacterium]